MYAAFICVWQMSSEELRSTCVACHLKGCHFCVAEMQSACDIGWRHYHHKSFCAFSLVRLKPAALLP